MDPQNRQGGLGPDAIQPINMPEMLSVVKDSVGGFPISVTYRPLLDRAAAGSRRPCPCTPVLTLANSGWVFGSTFVLWDKTMHPNTKYMKN